VELGGYIPMDGKVESFVRTKYELGKWKDEGQRDPARYVNVNVNANANVKPASTQASTPSSTSKATDSLDSLLDFGPPKSTPVVLSSSTSSLPDRSAAVNRRTNPTITLLEQHSGPSVLQKQQPQQQQPSQQQPQSQRNNRPDLKKSILSLYSTPSPSASYSNISSSASINHSGSSNSTTTSTFTTLQAQSQSQSQSNNSATAITNATGGNGIWSSTTPSTTQTRNYVGEDPFKNVWS
jgi:stromal membrane-associated protein